MSCIFYPGYTSFIGLREFRLFEITLHLFTTAKTSLNDIFSPFCLIPSQPTHTAKVSYFSLVLLCLGLLCLQGLFSCFCSDYFSHVHAFSLSNILGWAFHTQLSIAAHFLLFMCDHSPLPSTHHHCAVLCCFDSLVNSHHTEKLNQRPKIKSLCFII